MGALSVFPCFFLCPSPFCKEDKDEDEHESEDDLDSEETLMLDQIDAEGPPEKNATTKGKKGAAKVHRKAADDSNKADDEAADAGAGALESDAGSEAVHGCEEPTTNMRALYWKAVNKEKKKLMKEHPEKSAKEILQLARKACLDCN